MRRLLNAKTIAMLSLVFPVAAWANVTGTPTLTASQTLSLDAGTTGASGGDILWNGSTIAPQGSATAVNLSALGLGTGALAFGGLSQAELSAFAAAGEYSGAAIGSLAGGDILGVHTNGGNYAAVLVVSLSGTSINLQFTTFTSAGNSVPTITQVLNNYGLIPTGFSNSGIALGSLFIIKGSGLANTTDAVLQSSASPGLPTSLNGASVKVTVGSVATVPAFYYAIASQLALVMPSNTPVGAGTLTVTFNGQTTPPFNIQVVASAFGFDAYYGTGGGLGVATNAVTGALYNYSNAIPPGTQVVGWGSGLGADPTRDTTFSQTASFPFTITPGLAHIYVGGIDSAIGYQGASGYPGVNQVNFTIPPNAPTGCNVSVVGVTAAGVPTNFITLPIGVGVCSDAAFGTTGSTVSSLSGQSTVNTGVVFLDQSTGPAANGSGTQVSDVALAEFESHTGTAYGTATGTVSIGGCVVSESLSGTTTTGTTTGLDAGTITITGPNGNSTLTSEAPILPGFYLAQLATGFIPASGGSFTVTGSGGKDVGPFMTQIIYPNPVLTWTNQTAGATITRSAGVPITWSGGEAGTFVIISGTSSAGSASASFTCLAPVGPGQFTVPGYVTSALPVGSGNLAVANYTNYGSFPATGLDSGYALGFVSYGVKSTYQ
jgi:fibronectin-binding autotransporter adhesin